MENHKSFEDISILSEQSKRSAIAIKTSDNLPEAGNLNNCNEAEKRTELDQQANSPPSVKLISETHQDHQKTVCLKDNLHNIGVAKIEDISEDKLQNKLKDISDQRLTKEKIPQQSNFPNGSVSAELIDQETVTKIPRKDEKVDKRENELHEYPTEEVPLIDLDDEDFIISDPIICAADAHHRNEKFGPLHKCSLNQPEPKPPHPNTIKKLHSYSGPSDSLNSTNISSSYKSTPFLGILNPALTSPSSRRSSEVVKNRVAKLGFIPERPGNSESSTRRNSKRNSQGILSADEIKKYLDPLKRSQSEHAMAENKTGPNFPSRSTVDYMTNEVSSSMGNSIEKEESEVSTISHTGYIRQKDSFSRSKSGVNWKRKREFSKKRNPFVGVIGRSASVRTDASKSNYNFTSFQDPEELNQKFDSTPSLTNINQNSFASPGPNFSSTSTGRHSFSNSAYPRSYMQNNKSRSYVLEEPSLNSSPTIKRQPTTASLTAETAELLGTPTAVEFEAPTERSCSRGSGGLENNNALGLVYYMVLNAIRDSIQPNNSKMALKLFGSKKCVLKEKKRCEEEAPWIIHPFSTFRFCWDFTMLCLLITNMIVLPVAIAFFNEESSTTWALFNCVNDSLFVTDIVLNFRTGIAHQHMAVQVILDPKKIRKSYLRGWFIIDLISSMPMDYLFLIMSHGKSGSPSILNASRTLKMLRLTKFLSLMRLLRVSRLMRYANQWQEIFNLASAAIRILNLIFMMIIISHWNGCLMFLLPRLYEFPEDSWVYVDRLVGKEWTEQYSWALFRAMSHMLCIGYGQEPPTSIMDLWLVMISMISGATCYALFIGNATNMIHQFDSSRRQYTEKIKQVEEYMAHRKLPPDLQVRVHEYYEYKFKGKMFDEDVILDEMNDCLREEILNYNCRELVNVVPFFQGADPLFVSGVVAKLKHEVYQPGDYVIMEGTIGTKMFFIQQGTVDVVTNNGSCVAQLFDGSYFGEICLLAKIKRTASIRAESYCNLYSLEVEDFNEVLTEFPQMRCQLEMVARERLAQLGKRTNVLETKSRLKHQDTAYGIALSTDDFQEIAEMANEETRKMVRRLSVMLENTEIWAPPTMSRDRSPTNCECRRASEGHMTFEDNTSAKTRVDDKCGSLSVNEEDDEDKERQPTGVRMRIGSVSLGSLVRNGSEENEEENHQPDFSNIATGSDSEIVLNTRSD